jgi:hypothetical protein
MAPPGARSRHDRIEDDLGRPGDVDVDREVDDRDLT